MEVVLEGSRALESTWSGVTAGLKAFKLVAISKRVHHRCALLARRMNVVPKHKSFQ